MGPYEIAKSIHVSCAVATAVGFAWRGGLMLAGSPLLEARWVRTLPHVIDTLLLAAAVAMLIAARIDVRDVAWLQVKIAALAVYVVLGAVALRRGRTPAVRAWAFAAALAVLAFIFAVALNRGVPGLA